MTTAHDDIGLGDRVAFNWLGNIYVRGVFRGYRMVGDMRVMTIERPEATQVDDDGMLHKWNEKQIECNAGNVDHLEVIGKAKA